MRTLGLALGLFIFLALDLVVGGLVGPGAPAPNFALLFVLFVALYVENASPVAYWTAGAVLDLVVAPRPGLYALSLLGIGAAVASLRWGRRRRPGLLAQGGLCLACALLAEGIYGAASGAALSLGPGGFVRVVGGTALASAVLGPPVFFVTRCVAAFLGLQWQEAAAAASSGGGAVLADEPGAWRH